VFASSDSFAPAFLHLVKKIMYQKYQKNIKKYLLKIFFLKN